MEVWIIKWLWFYEILALGCTTRTIIAVIIKRIVFLLLFLIWHKSTFLIIVIWPADAKLDHYPIVNYPFFGIITVIVYLPLVSSILPTFMKNREAFNLKPFILVYNAFQILYNGFIVIKVTHSDYYFIDWCDHIYIFMRFSNKVLSVVISSGYDPFKCFESNSSESRLLVTIYFLNKLADLIETVLFALRKKQSQVSALHLIHHIYAILSAHYAIFLEQRKWNKSKHC